MSLPGDAERTRLAQVRRLAFARRLRELRAAQEWSQDALCRKARLDRSYYSELESGLHSPTLDILYSVADAYGITISQLFRSI